MIISKAPLRVSYVGGGSDLPSFYREHGGAVISSAIDKYVYVMVKDRFESGIRLSYSVTENVDTRREIEHPLVRNCLEMLEVDRDIELVSMADIPSSGSGLGSSSSFSVAMIHALTTYKGQALSTRRLAESACHLEIEKCLNPIGKQDQYASAFGGLRVYEFNKDDSVSETPVVCDVSTLNKLNSECVMFHVAGNRDANAILKQQSKELSNSAKTSKMLSMVRLVWDLKAEFESNNTDNFGPILHENWCLKRELTSGITNNYIDDIYTEALAAGATGGKLLGAGGGGFMLFHAPSCEVRNRISQRLHKLRLVPINFDNQGSRIIFND